MRRRFATCWLVALLCGASTLPLRAQDMQFRYGDNRFPTIPTGGDVAVPPYPGVQTRFQVQAAGDRLAQPAPDAAAPGLPVLPGQGLPPLQQPRLLAPMPPTPQYQAPEAAQYQPLPATEA
ncbi:MAG TPA: hypothetical protein VHY20_01805, partial [Pirellulales bacterium]|nr:hypothetical protein [Pirellulales bacterium]